jgi:hypothetical protein
MGKGSGYRKHFILFRQIGRLIEGRLGDDAKAQIKIVAERIKYLQSLPLNHQHYLISSTSPEAVATARVLAIRLNDFLINYTPAARFTDNSNPENYNRTSHPKELFDLVEKCWPRGDIVTLIAGSRVTRDLLPLLFKTWDVAESITYLQCGQAIHFDLSDKRNIYSANLISV